MAAAGQNAGESLLGWRRIFVVLLAVGAALLLWLLPVVVMLLSSASDYADHPRTFDANAWRANPDKRQFMGDDLVKRRLLHGKSKAEVQALLGESSSWDTRAVLRPWDDAEIRDYLGLERTVPVPKTYETYSLGSERSPFGVDGEFIVVAYDPRGRVAGTAVRTD